ncbi:VOC family protein [Actinoplanes sp. RD1]|uniref:VOC family protein n=1 Tax=Actinoplanes sp. RD1 TaxID=3064538 RepID=UPI00274222A7|nr:VOC family protein [Actinoplanes sp. RD1]
MSVPARLGVATLGVADVARASEFYSSLGWRLSPASVPGVVSWFHTTGGVLALVPAADLPEGTPGRPGAAVLTIPVAGPAEVDEALRAAVQAGASLVRAGGHRGCFADPDGHLWEITYYPEWPLDGSGVPRLP